MAINTVIAKQSWYNDFILEGNTFRAEGYGYEY